MPLWSICFSALGTKAAQVASPSEDARTGVLAHVLPNGTSRGEAHYTISPFYSHSSPQQLSDNRSCSSLQTEILIIIITVTASRGTRPRAKDLFCWILHITCLEEVSLPMNILIKFLVSQTLTRITINPLRNYMEIRMTRPYRNYLFLSLSLINLSMSLSCSETPCGRQRQSSKSSGAVNDPRRALLSQHRSSLVVVLWARAALMGCPHLWLVPPLYLTVCGQ